MQAVTTRPFEVALGSAASPYSLPGLHPGGFVGTRFQQPGERRFVTTDQTGTLGTTSYSPDQMVDSIGAVGALSAAMGSVPVTTLLPDETVRCGVGTGTYGGQYAGSLGCAAKVANRLFFNGGVAMTATDTVNSGAMGRLGFSFGFGGSPPKAKQAELAAIPAINGGGNSIFELGNGDGNTSPVNQALLAKQSIPRAIPGSEPDEAVQQRLAELEEELAELRLAAADEELSSAYKDALERIELLSKEKDELEKSLRQEIRMQRRLIEKILQTLTPQPAARVLED